ncbi:MAG: DEAD/DEAH box helicase, partial [Krumholzibacteria bacterium]|nr:DEAD/DEAH box helicase [Candidatus Krumholzibacteria bacterium]
GLDGLSLAARYWRDFGGDYLARLCHQPAPDGGAPELPAAAPGFLAGWVDRAPPLTGGEYLGPERLAAIRQDLDSWLREAVAAAGGFETFLAEQAPAWHRVGRVTFHLAENKTGAVHPFAFLATYTTGLGAAGRDRHVPLRQALESYAAQDDRGALVKLLTPVRAAAELLPWVRELVDSGGIYRPAAWTADQAHRLLGSLPELEQAGLIVRIPDWWHERPRAAVRVTVDRAGRGLLTAESLMELKVDVVLGGERLDAAELAALRRAGDGLVLLKGRWVEVDQQRLQEALAHWEGIGEAAGGELSFQEAMRLLAGAAPDLRGDADQTRRAWSEVVAGKGLRELLARLRDPSGEGGPHLPEHLAATLRPYQRDGVAWLHLLTGLGLGACLADDMGLGKTLQVLSLLAASPRRRDEPPALLVVPASLLGNWRAEAARFTPDLQLLFLHPSETPRERLDAVAAAPQAELAGYDLVVTTYGMAHRQAWLAQQNWRLAILDEAQAVKNPHTKQSRAVRSLRAGARVVLTGTPVENSLGDLWALFDFLNPGLLGSSRVFRDFVKGLEADGSFEPLRRLAGPYILRRLKTDPRVIADLPEKTEVVSWCTLGREQVKLYQGVVDNLARGLASTEAGIERRGLVLQALLRLKQVCNHPSQLTGDGAWDARSSGKFARLGEIAAELAARQEKALVFTQYREIIPALEDHLARIYGRPGLTLHGGTAVRRRQDLVVHFQQPDGPPFFVISLKAGGTGLNLTEACHVIHFDRWWNPAVEDQATDRAFRIGQVRNVLVHKFVTRGTVEEKIDALIRSKQELAAEVLGGDGVRLTELPDDELLELVRLDVTRAAS